MKYGLKKTDHYWRIARERGINQYSINCQLAYLTPQKGKSLPGLGKKKLSEVGIRLKNISNLVIGMKDRVIITVFEVTNMYKYVKSNTISNLKLFYYV